MVIGANFNDAFYYHPYVIVYVSVLTADLIVSYRVYYDNHHVVVCNHVHDIVSKDVYARHCFAAVENLYFIVLYRTH